MKKCPSLPYLLNRQTNTGCVLCLDRVCGSVAAEERGEPPCVGGRVDLGLVLHHGAHRGGVQRLPGHRAHQAGDAGGGKCAGSAGWGPEGRGATPHRVPTPAPPQVRPSHIPDQTYKYTCGPVYS